MKRSDQDSFAIGLSNKVSNFDFDAWLKLAQSAPDEFELKRREVIDGLIGKMSCRDDSLQKICDRIEQQRNSQPAKDALPWMMKELSKAFGQLNKEFALRATQWKDQSEIR